MEYLSGTFFDLDEDGEATEYKVIWAFGKINKWDNLDFILMEVNGKEEHECDEDIWRKCEEAREETALRSIGGNYYV
jgi:hypothetical protein